MKAQGAALTGALAVAGLWAAWATWQRPVEQTDTEVTVLGVSRSSLKSIRYEDDKRTVEVVPDGEGAWVRNMEKPAPPPPPAAAPGADGGIAQAAAAVTPPQPPQHPPVAREYRANDTALNLVEKFAPLRAVRALGVLPPEKLEEIGLAQSARTLEVVTATGPRRFKVSADAFGALSPYLQDEDGKVYVLRGTLLSDLEFASSRLVDRRLHTFRDDEYDTVVVTAGQASRSLVKSGNRWAPSADAAPDDFASNWHDRIWRSLGVDVLGRGETPPGGAPQLQVRVEYRKGSRALGFIELGRSGADVFARTEHTAGWVRLHATATQILDETPKVVAAQ